MANIEPLRAFQAEDLPWFLRVPKSLMLYEPRLGKTVEVCNIVAADPLCKVILVVCSKNALGIWMDHLPTWIKHLRPNTSIDVRVVRGKNSSAAATRRGIWSAPRTAEVTIYLVTAASLLKDWDYYVQTLQKVLRFDTVIADEFHRYLQNKATKTSVAFRVLVRQCHRFHPLSGTSTGKLGPANLWNVLNMCDPGRFSSYWRFVNQYCWVSDGQFGVEILGVRDIATWNLCRDQFSRVRERAICAPQMPPVVRSLLWVELNPPVQRMYTQLEKTMVTFSENGSLIITANSLETFTRKRQLTTCPAILDPTLGPGAAFEDLLERMTEAKEDDDLEGYHIVLFTGLRKAIPHWVDAFRAGGFPNVEVLHGGLEPEDLDLRIARFRQSKGIIICTTKFAQAFSLVPATQCYHIGWEFDPNDNKQAEDRLVPQSGDFHINSWYYANRETDDDVYAEALTQRGVTIRQTLYSGASIQTSDQ